MISHINEKMVTKGSLISYTEWCRYIDSLNVKAIVSNEEDAISLIKEPFEEAVKKQIPKEKFGILFSGGIDSTLIAYLLKRYTNNFICYTVGFEGSKDIEFSINVAKQLKLIHKRKILTLTEIALLFKRTAQILGNKLINIVNIGVGSVELAAIELGKQDGITIFFSGLGSEEIFAGYKRHENAQNINEECWYGLKSMWSRDFKRDKAISDYKKIVFITPFLDWKLITAAMKIDGSLKISKGHKKYILRKFATSIGLNEEFAFRPKSAAQYGSSFDKAISKLVKSMGFRYKKEYLDYLSSSEKLSDDK